MPLSLKPTSSAVVQHSGRILSAANLAGYFNDHTFVRLQVYGSFHLSWLATRVGGQQYEAVALPFPQSGFS